MRLLFIELDKVAHPRLFERLEPDAHVCCLVHREAAELVGVRGDVPPAYPVREQPLQDEERRERVAESRFKRPQRALSVHPIAQRQSLFDAYRDRKQLARDPILAGNDGSRRGQSLPNLAHPFHSRHRSLPTQPPAASPPAPP